MARTTGRSGRSTRQRRRNPWLALFAFGYAFLPVLGGIIVLAAGVKQAIVRYDQPATTATAVFLAGGVAVCVAGLALLRYVLRTGPLSPRLAMAGGASATVIVGTAVSPEAQIVALTLIMSAGIVYESRGWKRQRRTAAS